MKSSDSAKGARREFIKQTVALPVALTAVAQGCADASDQPAQQPKLPRIRLGDHSISRLVCGANPFNGGSHLSTFVNRQMKEYYTEEQIFKTLLRCQEVGINCWQSGNDNCERYRRFVDQGLDMRYISIDHAKSTPLSVLAECGCIAVAHHGEVTDRFFKTGQFDQVNEYLKKVRDSGMQVGVSTHMPDVVDAIESKGWDVDYYMTCVYERHRTAEDLQKLLGQAPIPVGEVYLPNDPPRMYKAVQATERPCLAFKILAAGRLSDRHQWVENAFRQAYESIKPTDGAIIGIYDKYSDQPAECAELVRRFTSTT